MERERWQGDSVPIIACWKEAVALPIFSKEEIFRVGVPAPSPGKRHIEGPVSQRIRSRS